MVILAEDRSGEKHELEISEYEFQLICIALDGYTLGERLAITSDNLRIERARKMEELLAGMKEFGDKIGATMILGKFYGQLESNKDKVYIVAADCTSAEAVAEANRIFKAKRDKLVVKRAYIESLDADVIHFTPFEGSTSVWAVSRR